MPVNTDDLRNAIPSLYPDNLTGQIDAARMREGQRFVADVIDEAIGKAYSDEALASAATATGAAADAQASAVAAALYDGPKVDNRAELDTITYTNASAGDLIRQIDIDATYEIAEITAQDIHDRAAAVGGIGLYDLNFAASARPFTQRILARLRNNLGDASLVIIGDSTGNDPTEWVKLLTDKLAADYPAYTVKYRLWDDTTSTYFVEQVVQVGTGPNQLRVYNGSVPGATSDWMLNDKFAVAVSNNAPDLVIMSYGLNGSTIVPKQIDMLGSLVAKLTQQLSDIPIILIGQNPRLDDATMSDKIEAFRAFAAWRGIGFIDVHSAFLQSPIARATLMLDNVHPNAIGSSLWARSVHSAFALDRGSSGALVSPLDGLTLYSAHSVGELSNWTIAGNAAIAADAVNFETSGGGIAVTNTAGATGTLSLDVVTSGNIKALRGKWVTLCVRCRIPTGEIYSAGRISLYDGIASSSTDTGGPQGVGFYWQFVSLRIDSAATYLRAIIYANTGTGAASFTVDRLGVVTGRVGKDFAPPAASSRFPRIELFGSQIAGMLAMRNSFSGANGLLVLSTASGTDADDPNTQFGSAIGGDYCAWKARGDVYPRLRITCATGALAFGAGTANPNITLSVGGTNRLVLGDASIEPAVDGARDLGLTNRRWSNVFANKIFAGPTSGGVFITSGAGTPEAVLMAPVGTLYLRTDGGAGTTLYVKESGAGNTGWVAK